MERSFSEALKQRRTYYSITNQSPISDQEIECIVNMTVRHVPSAFNSQSTRVVLLLGESHKKLWQIVKDALKKIVPSEAFEKAGIDPAALRRFAVKVSVEMDPIAHRTLLLRSIFRKFPKIGRAHV